MEVLIKARVILSLLTGAGLWCRDTETGKTYTVKYSARSKQFVVTPHAAAQVINVVDFKIVKP